MSKLNREPPWYGSGLTRAGIAMMFGSVVILILFSIIRAPLFPVVGLFFTGMIFVAIGIIGDALRSEIRETQKELRREAGR